MQDNRIIPHDRAQELSTAYARCVRMATALSLWRCSGNAAAIAEAQRDFDRALDEWSTVQRDTNA